MFHFASKLGVPERSVDALDEGGRNEDISYGSHHRDILSAKADDGSWELGGSVDDLAS